MERIPNWAIRAAWNPKSQKPFVTWRSCDRKSIDMRRGCLKWRGNRAEATDDTALTTTITHLQEERVLRAVTQTTRARSTARLITALRPLLPRHTATLTSLTTSLTRRPSAVIGHCKALYSYDGQDEGTLVMAEDEVLYIIEQDKGDGWTRVRKQNGDEGYVPTTYVDITLEKNSKGS
ncbi:hypothetical protein WMY93_025396 [Mugilogobius chulae]|uniref:SH3 domain-containing protein n=1 Tax=Mugilogobius chulae TaxID=88201 RepID=A0AAW0NEV4_9GOBI